VLLQQLIRIPSVNPMGRDVQRPEFLEGRVTDFLAKTFAALGLPYERHEVHPGRENIIARMPGENSGRTLLLEVHQDTVPVDGMTIPPFAGELREGRVWGRGACDVKGAMATILAAVSRLLREQPARLPNIAIACTVNEELGFTGAQHLAALWNSGRSKLLPQPPAAAIVSEPTELNVVVAHKGVVRWKCHAHGRAVHSSNPAAGENAIYRMMTILGSIAKYGETLETDFQKHPLLGRPTVSVGTIRGGISVNTVPDHCVIEIDRRLLPAEEPLDVWRQACQYIDSMVALADHHSHDKRPRAMPTHDEPFIVARGLRDEINGELAAMLVAAAKRAGIDARQVGVPFGTDAAAFGREVPTVVFGPGSIAQAHTEDEWIAVEQLQQATEVLYELCRRWE
jgi:acetylornithine deacetylase